MKKYVLEAVIDGELVRFNRKFNSRSDAMNYIFHYYIRHNLCDIKVNDEFYVDDNIHDIEYVYDYENRFRVTRI